MVIGGVIGLAASSILTIEKLEAMTCVCSVGLDMIAIPGDTKATTISGIIADEMAIGAAMAISQAGMQPGKDILVAGSDGGAAGLDAVKKGLLLVTAYQDNKGQAVGSVDLAVKMVKKEPYTAELTIPYQQITKANYQAFLNP